MRGVRCLPFLALLSNCSCSAAFLPDVFPIGATATRTRPPSLSPPFAPLQSDFLQEVASSAAASSSTATSLLETTGLLVIPPALLVAAATTTLLAARLRQINLNDEQDAAFKQLQDLQKRASGQQKYANTIYATSALLAAGLLAADMLGKIDVFPVVTEKPTTTPLSRMVVTPRNAALVESIGANNNANSNNLNQNIFQRLRRPSVAASMQQAEEQGFQSSSEARPSSSSLDKKATPTFPKTMSGGSRLESLWQQQLRFFYGLREQEQQQGFVYDDADQMMEALADKLLANEEALERQQYWWENNRDESSGVSSSTSKPARNEAQISTTPVAASDRNANEKIPKPLESTAQQRPDGSKPVLNEPKVSPTPAAPVVNADVIPKTTPQRPEDKSSTVSANVPSSSPQKQQQKQPQQPSIVVDTEPEKVQVGYRGGTTGRSEASPQPSTNAPSAVSANVPSPLQQQSVTNAPSAVSANVPSPLQQQSVTNAPSAVSANVPSPQQQQSVTNAPSAVSANVPSPSQQQPSNVDDKGAERFQIRNDGGTSSPATQKQQQQPPQSITEAPTAGSAPKVAESQRGEATTPAASAPIIAESQRSQGATIPAASAPTVAESRSSKEAATPAAAPTVADSQRIKEAPPPTASAPTVAESRRSKEAPTPAASAPAVADLQRIKEAPPPTTPTPTAAETHSKAATTAAPTPTVAQSQSSKTTAKPAAQPETTATTVTSQTDVKPADKDAVVSMLDKLKNVSPLAAAELQERSTLSSLSTSTPILDKLLDGIPTNDEILRRLNKLKEHSPLDAATLQAQLAAAELQARSVLSSLPTTSTPLFRGALDDIPTKDEILRTLNKLKDRSPLDAAKLQAQLAAAELQARSVVSSLSSNSPPILRGAPNAIPTKDEILSMLNQLKDHSPLAAAKLQQRLDAAEVQARSALSSTRQAVPTKDEILGTLYSPFAAAQERLDAVELQARSALSSTRQAVPTKDEILGTLYSPFAAAQERLDAVELQARSALSSTRQAVPTKDEILRTLYSPFATAQEKLDAAELQARSALSSTRRALDAIPTEVVSGSLLTAAGVVAGKSLVDKIQRIKEDIVLVGEREGTSLIPPPRSYRIRQIFVMPRYEKDLILSFMERTAYHTVARGPSQKTLSPEAVGMDNSESPIEIDREQTWAGTGFGEQSLYSGAANGKHASDEESWYKKSILDSSPSPPNGEPWRKPTAVPAPAPMDGYRRSGSLTATPAREPSGFYNGAANGAAGGGGDEPWYKKSILDSSPSPPNGEPWWKQSPFPSPAPMEDVYRRNGAAVPARKPSNLGEQSFRTGAANGVRAGSDESWYQKSIVDSSPSPPKGDMWGKQMPSPAPAPMEDVYRRNGAAVPTRKPSNFGEESFYAGAVNGLRAGGDEAWSSPSSPNGEARWKQKTVPAPAENDYKRRGPPAAPVGKPSAFEEESFYTGAANGISAGDDESWYKKNDLQSPSPPNGEARWKQEPAPAPMHDDYETGELTVSPGDYMVNNGNSEAPIEVESVEQTTWAPWQKPVPAPASVEEDYMGGELGEDMVANGDSEAPIEVEVVEQFWPPPTAKNRAIVERNKYFKKRPTDNRWTAKPPDRAWWE